MGERRDSKKRETRQRISDVATAMFFERGYDAVTIDEIAVAAKVAKMTVTNYFARKEELVLDREDELRLVPLREAIRRRPKGQHPIDALRGFVASLDDQEFAFARIDDLTVAWWQVVEASPALRARMRELAEEATELLAVELGAGKPDGITRLVAGMVVLTLTTARDEARRVFERGGSAKKVKATLLGLIDRGFHAARELGRVRP